MHVLEGKPATVVALTAAAGVSAALLAGAHIFEALGYPPCALCLDQREAHWAAIAVCLAGLGGYLVFKARLATAAAVGAAALVYALSAGLSFFHVGVEHGFWPGPATCSGGGVGITDAGDLSSVFEQEVRGPSCADAQWKFFGISMAGYNLLFSAGLFALTLLTALFAFRKANDARRPGAKAGEAART